MLCDDAAPSPNGAAAVGIGGGNGARTGDRKGLGRVDTVTILRCARRRRASKLIAAAADGSVTVAGYDAGRYFSVAERAVADLADLAHMLNVVSRDPRSFVVRGEPLPSTSRDRCRRLLYAHEDGTPPTFREVPRWWVVLDFDNVPGPYRFDPRDGALAGIYCRSLLPEPWRRCSFWWSLSSSAGIKPGVRIKLVFWLTRPMLGRELERHLAGCPVDLSTLRTVQPIYVARPILANLADPIRQRTGLEQDRDDAVTLPELPAETPSAAPATHDAAGRRYVSGASEPVAYHRLEALCRAVERASVGGRHRCLLWAAARAIELDDAIPRAVIAAELLAAGRRAGLDDHEAEIARQIRNGFKLGIFGTEAAA